MVIVDHPAFALPDTVEEALDAMRRRPAAAYVAGGTELMPDLLWRRASPAGFVSLRRAGGLRGITRPDGGEPRRIGATTTIAELLARGDDAGLPGLARAAASLGTPAVRAEATVGGNVMSALPYRNLLPVLLATGARLELASPGGTREVPFDGFILGSGRTAAEPGELLVAVLVPAATGFQDYVKIGPRNAQFVATASGAIALDATARTVRFGFGNAAGVPLRVPAADDVASAALDWPGGTLADPAALDEVADLVRRGVDPPADHVASAEYRRHALGVIARRLLARATGSEQSR